jgi:predicted permease
MSWREAIRLSNVAFTELSLQAVYAFRQGNVLPPGRSKNLVARSRRLVLQSKVVISAVLALLTLGAVAILHQKALNPDILSSIPVGLFQSAILTGLLSLDIALLWWTGVQVVPTLISSGVLSVLEPLPIDPHTFRRVAGILYLRLFDLPALTIIVLTPLAVGIALGPLAGLAALPGALVAVVYALALALLTGRFFLRRVQGSRGGGGRAVVRWAYLVLWLVPAFAMFAFITAAPAFFQALGGLAVQGPSVSSALLAAAFPFSFAALPAIVASGTASIAILSPTVDLVLGVAAAFYVALAVWSVVWLAGSVRTLLFLPIQAPAGLPTGSTTLRPTGRARAVLVKDLRIASRTPGYAFLILLPILDAGALGLLTYATPAQNPAAASLALGAVTTAALLATFFGPAFFAIEVVAYSYGRSLPISNRSTILGKVALISLMYLVAATLILGFTLLRFFQPFTFVVFVLAELPAVLGAAFFELGLLFRWARRRGLAITNLYAGAWFAVAISIPGLIMAGLPPLLFDLTRSWGTDLGLGIMALVAVAELALAAPVAFGRGAS